MLFSDYEDDGPMWTGQGPREFRRPVTFSEVFAAPPSVQVSIAMWDMDNARNQRADISAEEITPEGFEIVFRTWGDTRVARIRAAWTAIGPVPDSEDEWKLY
ncbi:H-type lectin domain-containing protein [Brevirhabdus pacifica]|uniref:H-type lectin domain-containing protein n=1 Tax=Brevirhabdus pacifica TaxID=1267768 RepID=UPI002AA56B90